MAGLIPTGMVDALDRIEDMADPAGFDAQLARVEASSGGPDWGARGTSPLRLAIELWVHQRERFERAEARRGADRAGLVREYAVREDLELRLPGDEEIEELATFILRSGLPVDQVIW